MLAEHASQALTYHRLQFLVFRRAHRPRPRLRRPLIITEASVRSGERDNGAKVHEHAPLRSHVSRDPLMPRTLTRLADARFPAGYTVFI